MELLEIVVFDEADRQDILSLLSCNKIVGTDLQHLWSATSSFTCCIYPNVYMEAKASLIHPKQRDIKVTTCNYD